MDISSTNTSLSLGYSKVFAKNEPKNYINLGMNKNQKIIEAIIKEDKNTSVKILKDLASLENNVNS